MFEIEPFWRPKLAGAIKRAASKSEGWLPDVAVIPGFVEPGLTLIEGDPETARLFVIAAPGAVGKSSFATALAAATNAVVVDLARTSVLGGNFFKGGIANAFEIKALSDAAEGKVALMIDALDEAHMRAGPEGYEAGLLDLAGIAATPAALPAVLLGRAIAAEDAFILLTANGFNTCLLQIDFFSDEQADSYLRNKLSVIAARSDKARMAFQNHGQVFQELAERVRAMLKAVAGCEKTSFAGYAPVLDAICEFTLDDEDGLNPQAKIAKLKSASQIELIEDITTSILEREQGKVQKQFKEKHPEVANSVLDKVYSIEEQIERVAYSLFGGPPPALPDLPKEAYYTTYQEMVDRFAPMHPFMSGTNIASNPVFAAYAVAWALRKSGRADLARRAVNAQPNLMSGILFDLYIRQFEKDLQNDRHAKLPLADVGILYQALNSRIAPGQRVQLEVLDQNENGGAPDIEICFEILEKIDPKTDIAPDGKTWGPYPTTPDTVLELRSPFSNVYVDAPIMVQLGDGIVQQIGTPTELSVKELLVSANQVLVQSGASDGVKELQTVTLIASEAACEGVQIVTVRDGTTLAVSWPAANIHPWMKYVVDVPPAANDDVQFMRRRLRKILTAFRSHSKGALVRLAAKIDHSRMTKDARGVALVNKLIEDKILIPFDVGKFYQLDPDVMGKTLGVGYHDLAQSRFTPESDSYLLDVLGRIKD